MGAVEPRVCVVIVLETGRDKPGHDTTTFPDELPDEISQTGSNSFLSFSFSSSSKKEIQSGSIWLWHRHTHRHDVESPSRSCQYGNGSADLLRQRGKKAQDNSHIVVRIRVSMVYPWQFPPPLQSMALVITTSPHSLGYVFLLALLFSQSLLLLLLPRHTHVLR